LSGRTNVSILRCHVAEVLLAEAITDELLESDFLVIATPMWNFGIPSALKAWIDLVVRPGKTFRYSDDGVLGLAMDKKAVLVVSSGGVFADGPWRPWDFVEPYLRQILDFISIELIRLAGRLLQRLRFGWFLCRDGPERDLVEMAQMLAGQIAAHELC
jgi:FMN-dependent NADH-azoreductase